MILATHEKSSLMHTATEDALEDIGTHPTRHYALRSDQLEDGTYRYALENPDTSEVYAEGIDHEAHKAMMKFEQAIKDAGLSSDEVSKLTKALDTYEAETA